MSPRRLRIWTAALLGALAFAPGGSCGGGGGVSSVSSGASGPTAALRVEPIQAVYFVGGYYLKVDVYVSADDPMQAWDLTLSWNTGVLEHLATNPAPESDDDGVFFQGPDLDEGAGTLGIVDLRHGTSSLTGNFRVAEVWFVAWNGGTANVTIGGSLSNDQGEAFAVIANTNGTFPVTP